MPLTPEEQATIDRFANTYRLGQSDFMLEIERCVCGCDYGGTSWTTREEADRAIEILKLKPRQLFLEVGAGSGWPGLYMAKRTRCDVVLTDLPLEGLQIAKRRAATDQLDGKYWVLSANGAVLPFADGSFDAIFHSDVLCCLVEKLAVLKSCRRIVRATGQMVFSVIYVAPDVTASGYEQAKAGGPPFVESDLRYPDMLRQAGWEIVERLDLTAKYLESTRAHAAAQERYANQIRSAFGEEEAQMMLARRQATVSALENGLLRRELFHVLPSTPQC